MPITRKRIESNLAVIRENIAEACGRAGRDPNNVRIVAVTKAVDVEAVKHLLDLGLTDLGENRVSQLAKRAEEIGEYLLRRRKPLARPVCWHMIGHLQRNKVRQVLAAAQFLHSVDSLRLAEEIQARAEKMNIILPVFMQVNCSKEPQKYGVAMGAAMHLGEMISVMKNLRLVGLMTMAELSKDPEKARPSFARLRELFDEMRNDKIGGEHLRHLSMGMSNDYVVAVEEGATILRIGSALFA